MVNVMKKVAILLVTFLGRAFSEAKLLAIGYSLEQATHARRLPLWTPQLQGELIRVP